MSENEELVKRLREQAQNASPADPTIRVEWQAAAALSRSGPAASGPSEEEIRIAEKYRDEICGPDTEILARAVLRWKGKL